ncbi:MAG: plastocyanin/azurin family copper-binding protein [Verrucomicrobia bacterium]|nr:plastocyanin/azurin family copper-binding protein [Verrucomicrobiota bacterium]
MVIIRAFPPLTSFLILCLPVITPAQSEAPNVADPTIYLYADPVGGREGHRYTDHPVNEFRLYDFYQRQADYYMQAKEVPEIIPAYPGMEAGLNGHWGKYNQFDLFDDIWSRMDNGPIVSSVIRQGGDRLVKAINLRLGQDQKVFATFDPLQLSYRMVWKDDFLIYPEVRWGMMGLVEPGTNPLLQSWSAAWSKTTEWGKTYNAGELDYKGLFRYGNEVVFSYKVHGTAVLENPGAIHAGQDIVFTRTLHFPEGAKNLNLKFFKLPDEHRPSSVEKINGVLLTALRTLPGSYGLAVRSTTGLDGLKIEQSDDDYMYLSISELEAGATLTTYSWKTEQELAEIRPAINSHNSVDLNDYIRGGPTHWPEEFVMAGELGEGNDPYVIDTIPVPIENPFASPMYLSGVSFFDNGDAAVATFFGDLWLVKGLDKDLKKVTWRRIAQGINQPLGLDIVEGKIHAICKDQITIFHDLNGNQEIDYFENFCNSFRTSPGGHDYNTGLQRDAKGNFYFATKHDGIYQISPDGKKIRIIADGLRNPNGIGVAPDGRVWVTPQEGQWNPTSEIFHVREGDYYGYQYHTQDKMFEPATAYIPRGIDNSTGGQLYITTDKWGPMKDQLISLSYGTMSNYLVLEDLSGPRAQGAIVPLKGDFISSVHRARIHPIDEQVYAVGLQGWGNYSQTHGSFERIRYTGKPVYYPMGFQVFQNGIRVDFDQKLSAKDNNSVKNFFAQQWEYIYTMGYGSPEFSMRHKENLGHDRLEITSTHVLGNGKSLFVEIPDLVPAMTIYLRMHLHFTNGAAFKTDLFATALDLGRAFIDFPNPLPIIKGKPQEIELVLKMPPPVPDVEPGSDEPGRPIHLKALTGLKYDQTRISASPGERISLTLENIDVMPHNWVMVRWEGYVNVGEKADLMVSDPNAAAKQYIPDDKDIMHYTRLLNPGEKTTIHFNAPIAPGHYPFLCTFPGHWRVMRGYLIVY